MDDVHLSTARHFRYELRRKIFSSNLERGRCAAHHNYYWLCIRVIIITICVNDHWREWCHCCQWRHDSVAIAHWHHQLSSFILANKSPLNGVIGRPFKWNHWWPIAIWCTIGTIWCITIGINGLPLVSFCRHLPLVPMASMVGIPNHLVYDIFSFYPKMFLIEDEFSNMSHKCCNMTLCWQFNV